MGIRLEIVLISLIIVVVVLTATVKLRDTAFVNKTFYKELEFTNTTFIEVDDTKIQAKVFASYGVRDNGILTLKKLKYRTKNIEELLANKGTYKENILFLDGKIRIYDKKGFEYRTEHLHYNQKTEVLEITAPFVAQMYQNIIKGDSLHYNLRTKELNATGINAIIYTLKK